MHQFMLVGGRAEGQQVAGPQHHALAATPSTTSRYNAAETELDPVKRAALFIKMNDMVVNDHVVIPVVYRPRVAAACANELTAPISAAGTTTSGDLQDWYREA